MAKSNKPLGFGERVDFSDMLESAREVRDNFGRTDLYSTGVPVLDDWLGGGFGKKGAFECIVILASPGVGKSTLSMQMLMDSVKKGVPQGWAVMEDDIAETTERFIRLFPSVEEGEEAVANSKVELMPQTFMNQTYTLDDIADWFEFKAEQGISLFLLDNLQFCFDDASIETNGKALEEHRRFMKRLNLISKERKLTLILISHTNKNTAAKGMNRILGSSAIQQIATKVIELERLKEGDGAVMWLHKNRYAPLPCQPLLAERHGFPFHISNGSGVTGGRI